MAIEKGLLIHWWHYYGKVIYTLAELEEFEKVIDEYGANKVLDVAVASYVCGDGSPTIFKKKIFIFYIINFYNYTRIWCICFCIKYHIVS